MIIRKSNLVAATFNSFPSLHIPSSTSSTGSSEQLTRPRKCRPCRRAAYATITGDSQEKGNQDDSARKPPTPPREPHVWPSPPHGHINPTPYQIFTMKQNATYTKSRFYELVKIYHPDLNPTTSSSLTSSTPSIPHHIRLERYRLIITAHTILSDPIKRSAYDRFGAGWNGRAEKTLTSTPSSSPTHPSGPFNHNWHTPNHNPDHIWNNATWEDWERYHARHDHNPDSKSPPSGPVYMANSTFLALVLLLAVVGSSMNLTRAQDAGHYLVERRDIVHDRAAKDLRRVRMESSGLASRQDRIEFFVRQREATMGVNGDMEEEREAIREERAGRVLAGREVCGSGSAVEGGDGT